MTTVLYKEIAPIRLALVRWGRQRTGWWPFRHRLDRGITVDNNGLCLDKRWRLSDVESARKDYEQASWWQRLRYRSRHRLWRRYELVWPYLQSRQYYQVLWQQTLAYEAQAVALYTSDYRQSVTGASLLRASQTQYDTATQTQLKLTMAWRRFYQSLPPFIRSRERVIMINRLTPAASSNQPDSEVSDSVLEGLRIDIAQLLGSKLMLIEPSKTKDGAGQANQNRLNRLIAEKTKEALCCLAVAALDKIVSDDKTPAKRQVHAAREKRVLQCVQAAYVSIDQQCGSQGSITLLTPLATIKNSVLSTYARLLTRHGKEAVRADVPDETATLKALPALDNLDFNLKGLQARCRHLRQSQVGKAGSQPDADITQSTKQTYQAAEAILVRYQDLATQLNHYRARLEAAISEFQSRATVVRQREVLKESYRKIRQVLSEVVAPNLDEGHVDYRWFRALTADILQDKQRRLASVYQQSKAQSFRCDVWSSAPLDESIKPSTIYLYGKNGQIYYALRRNASKLERRPLSQMELASPHYEAVYAYLTGYVIEREKSLPYAAVQALQASLDTVLSQTFTPDYYLDRGRDLSETLRLFYPDEWDKGYFPVYCHLIRWQTGLAYLLQSYLEKTQSWFDLACSQSGVSLASLLSQWREQEQQKPLISRSVWQGEYKLSPLPLVRSFSLEPGRVYCHVLKGGVGCELIKATDEVLHYEVLSLSGKKIEKNVTLEALIPGTAGLSTEEVEHQRQRVLAILKEYKNGSITVDELDSQLGPYVLNHARTQGFYFLDYEASRRELLRETSEDLPSRLAPYGDLFPKVLSYLRCTYVDTGLSAHRPEPVLLGQHCLAYLKRLRASQEEALSWGEACQPVLLQDVATGQTEDVDSGVDSIVLAPAESGAIILRSESCGVSVASSNEPAASGLSYTDFLAALLNVSTDEADAIQAELPHLVPLLTKRERELTLMKAISEQCCSYRRETYGFQVERQEAKQGKERERQKREEAEQQVALLREQLALLGVDMSTLSCLQASIPVPTVAATQAVNSAGSVVSQGLFAVPTVQQQARVAGDAECVNEAILTPKVVNSMSPV